MNYHLLTGDNFATSQLTAVALVLIALVLLGIGGFIWRRRARALEFDDYFGSEFDRAVLKFGSAHVAQARLADPEAWTQTQKIREIGLTQRERFLTDWQTVESTFAEHPWTAVTEADDLVNELFEARGYPLAAFELRAADIPAGLPRVAENYRAAHSIVARRTKIAATTEELRSAMCQYRDIFHDLLQLPKTMEASAAAYAPFKAGSVTVPDQS